MNVSELLTAADAMLTGEADETEGVWPRGAAILTREAIERTCDVYWRVTVRDMCWATMRQQWLALPAYLGRDPAVPAAEHAWAALSEACHQRSYEVGLTAAELRAHLETATRFRDLVGRAVHG